MSGLDSDRHLGWTDPRGVSPICSSWSRVRSLAPVHRNTSRLGSRSSRSGFPSRSASASPLFAPYVDTIANLCRISRTLEPSPTKAADESPAVGVAEQVIGVEVKSGATLAHDFFDALRALPDLVARAGEGRQPVACLVYGGVAAQERSDAWVVPWKDVQTVSWL